MYTLGLFSYRFKPSNVHIVKNLRKTFIRELIFGQHLQLLYFTLIQLMERYENKNFWFLLFVDRVCPGSI